MAVLLLTGCLKDESGANTYLFKPLVQYTSGDIGEPLTEFVAYAFAGDTTTWGVASYDDALAGILTLKEGAKPTTATPTPLATTEPYLEEGMPDRFSLAL
ncbi:MAG: hypothetical protein IJ028_04815, partial [Alistipes sp.]|nr:hypothetical protein [Alistipes sp.]